MWVRLYIDMIYGTREVEGGTKKLSLCEVDDLRGRAGDRFDVLPFDFLSFSESAPKFLDLFLKEAGRIRNRALMTRGTAESSHPQSCHLVPLNRVLALSNDGRFFRQRAPLPPLFTLRRG